MLIPLKRQPPRIVCLTSTETDYHGSEFLVSGHHWCHVGFFLNTEHFWNAKFYEGMWWSNQSDKYCSLKTEVGDYFWWRYKPRQANYVLSALVISVVIPQLHKRIELLKFFMENSKVFYIPEWEYFLIFRNVMYAMGCPPTVCTDLDEQHFNGTLLNRRWWCNWPRSIANQTCICYLILNLPAVSEICCCRCNDIRRDIFNCICVDTWWQ
jgi:hypothetical protein